MRRLSPLLSVLGAVAVACATEPNESVRTEYEIERESWRAIGSATYTYQLRISCFCPGGPYPVRVTVEDGSVTSLEWVDPTPDFPGGDPDPDFYGRTIEDLYDVISDALDAPADTIEVMYDSGAHYPTQISIDYYVNAVDDEITYQAWGLETAPAPAVNRWRP